MYLCKMLASRETHWNLPEHLFYSDKPRFPAEETKLFFQTDGTMHYSNWMHSIGHKSVSPMNCEPLRKSLIVSAFLEPVFTLSMSWIIFCKMKMCSEDRSRGGQGYASHWQRNLVGCKSHPNGISFEGMKESWRAVQAWHCVAGLNPLKRTTAFWRCQ